MESTKKENGLAEKSKKNKGDNPEDCQVCMTTFDDTLQRPRTLPCGHTFCTPCVNRLTECGQVICAACRLGHAVPEAGQFPINFSLEAVITRGSDSETASTSSSPRINKRSNSWAKSGGSFGRKIRSMLQEQEAKVLAALDACQKVQSQLAQYQRTLAGWGSHQQLLEDKLQSVINDSKSARVLVRQEEAQVLVKKEEVQQETQRLHGVLDVLRRAATEEEVGVAVVDVVHCTHDSEEMLEDCRAKFPNVHTFTAARRVREASMVAVEAMKTVHASIPAPDTPSDAFPMPVTASITDKIQTLLTPTLKAEDLRNMTLPAQTLVQAEMVVAVKKMEDKRHARISVEEGRLYVHALQDQPLPHFVARLQMNEVVPAAPPCLVFLDFAWPEVSPSRVLLHLRPDTPMGRQFLLLCTGQQGPSYAHTRLWRVRNRGKGGESICGGDYERNDGTGGASVVPNLETGEYWRSGRAGSVWGWAHRGSAHGALFGIITRDRQDGRVLSGVFGEVVCGLEVVAAAAQHEDIKEVSVVDCGVVLCGALVPHR